MSEPREESSRPRGGRRRLLLATVLAPLALIPATIVWQLALAVAGGGPRVSPGVTLAGSVVAGSLLGAFGLFVAFPLTVGYLLPVALLFRRWGNSGPLAILGAGVVGGGAFGVAEGPFSTAFYAYLGATVASAFWAIGRNALATRNAGPMR